MFWVDATDEIERAKRLRAAFDGNTALDPADRRLLVAALSDRIRSYHKGHQVVTQAEEPSRNRSFGRIAEAIRGL